ncbi:hypothetical protein B0H16DRAFT_1891555 [Mycena metata]|uniref:Uncharacterized protein n=1 Tax=Mycena metata TaxID=1033252 RepID=A0AAD7MY72_9AGAR|nr:hypothetical protein B0H16DRAFT_1891555 [Mycena metata]
MSFPRAGVPVTLLAESDPQGPHRTMLINVFLALQMLGLIGSCALVLTTTLSRRAPRSATWQNFFTSWIISTVSYALLLFGGQLGQMQAAKDPMFGVCLAQAGLVYGIPSLTAATTFGLIAQIWFSVQSLLARKVKHEQLLTIGLLILPYVILASMVIASWAAGIHNPQVVRIIGSGMYCHIDNSSTLGRVSAVLVALTMIPTVALEIMICVSLRRNWETFKRMKHSLAIILRVVIFTIFGILAISLSAVFVFSSAHGAGLNIVFATMPVVAVVVFSTQKDILSVWMFWKRPSKEFLNMDGAHEKTLPGLPSARSSVSTVQV